MWSIRMLARMCVLAVVVGPSISAASADDLAERQLPIKELYERTSSLVGRDVMVVGVAEAVEAITEENFDDWRLMSPCVGSYYVTLKDDTGVLDVLVRGNCILRHAPMVNASWILKGQRVWMKVTIFVPDLNPFALNPLVRARAKDFGPVTPE